MEQTLPLQNTSIVITRPAHQNHSISKQLNHLGAKTYNFPCIEILANHALNLSEIEKQLAECDVLIFISSNAVNQLFAQIPKLNDLIPKDCNVCAVGAATASSLNQRGIQQVLLPDRPSDSEQLLKLQALQEVKEKMILIIKGTGGRELLYNTLNKRGADVINIEVYKRALPKLVDITPLTKKIDLILFTSSETVSNFLALTTGSLQESLLTCQTVVGHPRIAEKVTSLGFEKLPIIAATPSDADMIAAIHQWVK